MLRKCWRTEVFLIGAPSDGKVLLVQLLALQASDSDLLQAERLLA